MKRIISFFLILLIIMNFINTKTLKKKNPIKKTLSNERGKINQFSKVTNDVDDKDGDIAQLSKLNIKCEKNEVLQGFHLTRPKANHIAYKYECEKNAAIRQLKEENKTDYIPVPNNISGLSELEKHEIKCKEGYAIQQFKLDTIDKGRSIAYHYTCVQVYLEKPSCIEINTPSSDASSIDGITRSFFLGKQSLLLNPNQAFISLKAIVTYSSSTGKKLPHLSYNYRVCDFISKEKLDELNKTTVSGLILCYSKILLFLFITILF